LQALFFAIYPALAVKTGLVGLRIDGIMMRQRWVEGISNV
jgi:hypothetical protein